MLLPATDPLLPGTLNSLPGKSKKSEFAPPQQKSWLLQGTVTCLRNFSIAASQLHPFFSLQGKREDKASHCSPETESGGEGS